MNEVGELACGCAVSLHAHAQLLVLLQVLQFLDSARHGLQCCTPEAAEPPWSPHTLSATEDAPLKLLRISRCHNTVMNIGKDWQDAVLNTASTLRHGKVSAQAPRSQHPCVQVPALKLVSRQGCPLLNTTQHRACQRSTKPGALASVGVGIARPVGGCYAYPIHPRCTHVG